MDRRRHATMALRGRETEHSQMSVAGCSMRARPNDGFWNDRKEIEALIAYILSHVPPGSDPIHRAGGPAVFGHHPICTGISQMCVGKPDHQPRTDDVVHRGLLTRGHVYADN